ncbi:MAG TPA: hypothetical protein VNO33_07800, partial [Kofleriaceae bacterium]|nr:hypothetical protein [Kofleriaceae bacterium]
MKKGSISLLLASALSACSWGGDADREAISGQRSPLTAGDHSATANAANKITVLKNWIGIAQAGGVVDILNYTGVDNTTGDAGLIKTERAFARNAGFTVAVYGAHGLPSKVQAMPKKTARGSVFIRNNPQNNAFEKYVLSVCWGGSNNGAANFIDVASWVHKYYGVAANKIIACKGGNVHPGETDMVCAGTQVVDGAGANIGPVVNLPGGTKFRLPARENEKLGPSRCGGVRGDPCEDGMDNDGDGLTDANDPDCANDPEEECTDGSDNDEDGATDCTDSDCVFEPTCASPFEECDNGLDD